ncbi:peptidyl-prolyl cis-trans isomerase [Prolixibacter bellariivorans]|uniref:Peptidyl-prolyl cis-trans isomerase n=1 Tax=Prolixibacter bellariivorans TaxID=314319 RepID=A0A5M4B1M5_9BACT|nr:FKBP-type peptidyl-prolyl cis-trans isomerase [Prolixibacter bellariivorans]GET33507.1 peptidyl-prolyl cis-trans isomerase [Prolixibacter bellariivorans]
MSKKELNSQVEKFSYSIGLSVASNLIGSGIKTIDAEAFNMAIEDAYEGQMPKISADEANQIIQEYISRVQDKEKDENLNAGKTYLEENKKKQHVEELPSGMQFEVMVQGDGELPSASDNVKCHYHGTLIDGTVFDSSVQRGEPAQFPVNGVIQGWQEALQLMPVGSKWKLFIPPHLAYGENGAGGVIGPNATLIFEVELLEIVK